MQTDTSFHAGKNLIFISVNGLILQKTKGSKAKLIFWDIVLFGIVGFMLIYLARLNQARLRLPEDFFSRLLVVAALVGLLYFIFYTIRTTVNESKDYVIRLNNLDVLVNNQLFASHPQVGLQINKRVGWKGIGESYEIYLTKDGKRKSLSFGNSLIDARKVATLIGNYLGVGFKEMYAE